MWCGPVHSVIDGTETGKGGQQISKSLHYLTEKFLYIIRFKVIN